MTWCISLLTLLSMELMVRRCWWTWPTMLANQLLWFVFIVHGEYWGLLPLNLAMWVQGIRGWLAWRKSP